MTTGCYMLVSSPRPEQTRVHVYMDPSELGRVYRPDLPICASMARFARAARALEPVGGTAWSGFAEEARRDYLDNLEPTRQMPGPLDMAAVMDHLNAVLPEDAVIVTDAGNFSGWAQRFYRFRR